MPLHILLTMHDGLGTLVKQNLFPNQIGNFKRTIFRRFSLGGPYNGHWIVELDSLSLQQLVADLEGILFVVDNAKLAVFLFTV